jgi:hypothetical protein
MTAMVAVDLLAQAGEKADSVEDALGVVQAIVQFAGRWRSPALPRWS